MLKHKIKRANVEKKPCKNSKGLWSIFEFSFQLSLVNAAMIVEIPNPNKPEIVIFLNLREDEKCEAFDALTLFSFKNRPIVNKITTAPPTISAPINTSE